MNAKRPFLYPIAIGLLATLFFSYSLVLANPAEMNLQPEGLLTGANTYQQNHEQFKYYIGSIGYVTIDQVALDKGTLTATYSYKNGGETRHVISVLELDNDGIYKGTCTTNVNGELLFAVNTWLTFAQNGTASGHWSWSGTPSKTDPEVKISKK